MFQCVNLFKEYKNGAFVFYEKNRKDSFTWYEVRLRAPNGELYDKVRCDDYRAAMDYWKSFNSIAKNL